MFLINNQRALLESRAQSCYQLAMVSSQICSDQQSHTSRIPPRVYIQTCRYCCCNLPRQEYKFFYGACYQFLEYGNMVRLPGWKFCKGAYFIGKGVWAKGFDGLLDRYTEHVEFCHKNGIVLKQIDVYCNGPHMNDFQQEDSLFSLEDCH